MSCPWPTELSQRLQEDAACRQAVDTQEMRSHNAGWRRATVTTGADHGRPPQNLRPGVQAAGQQARPGYPWASGHPVAFGYNQTACARDKMQLRSVPRLGRGTVCGLTSGHVSGSQVWHCHVWSTSTGGWIQAQDPTHHTQVTPGTRHDVQCPWAETGVTLRSHRGWCPSSWLRESELALSTNTALLTCLGGAQFTRGPATGSLRNPGPQWITEQWLKDSRLLPSL